MAGKAPTMSISLKVPTIDIINMKGKNKRIM